MNTAGTVQPMILAVDDEASNLYLLRQILQDDYRLLLAHDGNNALALAHEEKPALILLDVSMPGMSGLNTCRALKAQADTADIPIIFVTDSIDAADALHGLEAGAVDYLTKPYIAPIVHARVRTHLALARTEELRRSRLEIVQRLGLAAEYKDNETGLHVIRMSHYARILGLAAGMDEHRADDLLHAAPMHDVGKIGIPDSILQKPAALDRDEWRVMQSHATIGADIIGQHAGGMLAMAHDVALTHHEKWDGSGYPNGLQGEAIPLVGRIVAIADVFDALTSARPYKAAWPVDQAVEYLKQQRGQHFDPELVELFLAHLPEVLEVMKRWAER